MLLGPLLRTTVGSIVALDILFRKKVAIAESKFANVGCRLWAGIQKILSNPTSSRAGKSKPYTLARTMFADVATAIPAWIMSMHAVQSPSNLDTPGRAVRAACSIARASAPPLQVIHGGGRSECRSDHLSRFLA